MVGIVFSDAFLLFLLGFSGKLKSRSQRSRGPKQARISLLWRSNTDACSLGSWEALARRDELVNALLRCCRDERKHGLLFSFFKVCCASGFCLNMDTIMSLELNWVHNQWTCFHFQKDSKDNISIVKMRQILGSNAAPFVSS